MLVASATYSSRVKSRKGLPAEEKEEERKTTIETALSPSLPQKHPKRAQGAALPSKALAGKRIAVAAAASRATIMSSYCFFIRTERTEKKEERRTNDRGKKPRLVLVLLAPSLSFFSQQKRATPVQKSSLAHGGHGGASQPRPCDLPRVADGDEGAGEERGDAAEDREGRDGERLRRRAEGARVGLLEFFFFFSVAGGREAKGREEGSEIAANKAKRIDAPPAPLSEKKNKTPTHRARRRDGGRDRGRVEAPVDENLVGVLPGPRHGVDQVSGRRRDVSGAREARESQLRDDAGGAVGEQLDGEDCAIANAVQEVGLGRRAEACFF